MVGERQGNSRGTAWEQHGMCESELSRDLKASHIITVSPRWPTSCSQVCTDLHIRSGYVNPLIVES
jgi:hypothetical protein